MSVFIFYLLCLFFTGNKVEELDSDDLDDDDDEDIDNDDEEGSFGHAELNGTESLKGLRGYMEQMDQELMSTNVGQSFKPTVTNHGCYTFCGT